MKNPFRFVELFFHFILFSVIRGLKKGYTWALENPRLAGLVLCVFVLGGAVGTYFSRRTPRRETPPAAAPVAVPKADNAEQFLRSAERYFEKSEFPSALIEYRNAAQRNPASIAAHRGIGLSLMNTGRPGEAVASFQEVLKLAPDDTDAHFCLANCYQVMGDTVSAFREINVVLASANPLPEAFFLAGRLHLRAGDAKRAEDCFVRACAGRDPPPAAARVGLASAYRRQGKHAEAAEQIEAALAEEPENTAALVERAAQYAAQGMLRKAVDQYEEVLADHAGDFVARVRLAQLLTITGRHDRAVEMAEDLLRSNPSEPRPHLTLARAYFATGLYSKALEHAKLALGLDSNSIEAHVVAARAHMARGEHKEALYDIQGGLEKDPDALSLLLLNGRVLLTLDRRAEAMGAFRAAAEKKPGSPLPLIILGALHLGQGERDKALAEYEKALLLAPNHPVAGNNVAAMLLDNGGDVERAYELAKRLHERNPRNARIADTYGWACVKREDYEQALAALALAVHRAPRNGTVLYHYAVALQGAGDILHAEAELVAALAGAERFPEAEAARRLLDSMRRARGEKAAD